MLRPQSGRFTNAKGRISGWQHRRRSGGNDDVHLAITSLVAALENLRRILHDDVVDHEVLAFDQPLFPKPFLKISDESRGRRPDPQEADAS